MSKKPKTFTLKPNWKYNLIPYLVSILLLPLFGIGIIVFIYYWLRLQSIKYVITDDGIRIISHGSETIVSISDMNSVALIYSWSEKHTGLGTIKLQSNEKDYFLIGIENPGTIKEAVELAIANEERRKNLRSKARGFYPDIKVGGLEEMNDLVGLWQQGLITNEDFEREKKKYS